MSEPTDDQLKLLAALASGYQSVDDRTRQLETVFKDSIIIPGNKVNAILIASTVILLFAIIM